MREALNYRPEIATELFDQEHFGVAQSIAETCEKLYDGQKSQILKRFSSCANVVIPTQHSAMICDLSVFIKSHYFGNNKLFSDFAISLYNRIMNYSSGYLRCDIVADRYFKGSLKEAIRNKRGDGSRKIFNDMTEMLKDFNEFLGNSEIKNSLSKYLAEKFIDIHGSSQVMVVTYENTILTNHNLLLLRGPTTFKTQQKHNK